MFKSRSCSRSYIPYDSRLRSEALFKFEGYTDVQILNRYIFVPVAIGNIIGNSQTCKANERTAF